MDYNCLRTQYILGYQIKKKQNESRRTPSSKWIDDDDRMIAFS